MMVIPCLSDLIRDWMDDKPELHRIIIHKVKDGRATATSDVVGRLLVGNWLVGYIEDDYVDLRYANRNGGNTFGIVHATDPDFFNKLYMDFLKIGVI